jgi:hypothetical protein
VAEGARLESVYTGNRIVGSNPTPSASVLPKTLSDPGLGPAGSVSFATSPAGLLDSHTGRRGEMTLRKTFFSRALYSEAKVRFWRRHKIQVFRMPFTSLDLEIHSLVQFESMAGESQAPKFQGLGSGPIN